jgi:hypothetical protein
VEEGIWVAGGGRVEEGEKRWDTTFEEIQEVKKTARRAGSGSLDKKMQALYHYSAVGL